MIIQIIPAPGWRYSYVVKINEPWEEDLMGWGLTSQGTIEPLYVDANNEVRRVSSDFGDTPSLLILAPGKTRKDFE